MPPSSHINRLAGELFCTFARAEYALKAAGYNKGDGPAQADWSKFAIAIDELIANTEDPKLSTAINFLLNSPPKKQIIKDGIIQWQVSTPAHNSKAENLLVYIRRIRNNLFHGGKFNGHWFDPERSRLLLDHCITVLEACINSEPLVYQAYRGSLPL